MLNISNHETCYVKLAEITEQLMMELIQQFVDLYQRILLADAENQYRIPLLLGIQKVMVRYEAAAENLPENAEGAGR